MRRMRGFRRSVLGVVEGLTGTLLIRGEFEELGLGFCKGLGRGGARLGSRGTVFIL